MMAIILTLVLALAVHGMCENLLPNLDASLDINSHIPRLPCSQAM